MLCYKCKQEMEPVMDTAWRHKKTGERHRCTEFICVECRVYVSLEVDDYSECVEDE